MKTQKTKRFIWLCAAVTTLFLLVACPQDSPDPGEQKHEPYGNPVFSGSVDNADDVVQDTHEHGLCKVAIKLTLVNGVITEVTFPVKENHSAGLGDTVLSNAPKKIIDTNSVEIDVKSGASVSSRLVIAAGKKALAKIPGYTP